MKSLKKALSLLLTLCLVFSLSACIPTSNDPTTPSTSETDSPTEPVQPTEDETTIPEESTGSTETTEATEPTTVLTTPADETTVQTEETIPPTEVDETEPTEPAVQYPLSYRNLIYESAKYHNAVFAGYDKQKKLRHAHKRGTGSESAFKGNATGSEPEYSFHWVGADDSLYLFEAPIDLLSFISMNKAGWRNHSYAASCSVSDRVIWQMLKDYPYIRKIYICFDNDAAGQEAARKIQEKLSKLKRSYNRDNHADVFDYLLASNMISVGVDVGRLGAMVVAGQPKTMEH